jgi:hypothetical protein
MLLRRITIHVKEQNWFAAGLDFFIVVACILIAFQITSWNETIQDRQDERRYLAELSRDADLNVTRAQAHQVSTLQRLAYAEQVLKQVDPSYARPAFWPVISEQISPNPDFADYPYAALTTSVYLVGADSTFKELIQTGQIGVLTNRQLVSNFTEFYNQLEQYSNEDDIVFAQVQPMLGYLRVNGLGFSDETSLTNVIECARTDQEFLGYIKMAAFISQWQYVNIRRVETRAQALRAMLDAESAVGQ